MCGISGFYLKNQNHLDNVSLLKKMSKSLQHRGPDAYGTFINKEKSCYLAHRRLAIIDTSPEANQPYTENERALTFNGAIYNYIELREKYNLSCKTNSDTEVLFLLLEKYGEKIIPELDGMFAFTFYHNEKMIIARDSIGIKPLYFYENENIFLFASEVKAILQYPLVDKELNKNMIHEYLSAGYIETPNTPFKNIFQLEPGHYLTIKNKKISKFSYKTQVYDKKLNSGPLKKAHSILEDCIKKQIRSDVKYTSFLSGGIDSSTIAYFINLFNKNISFSTFNFRASKYSEIHDAQNVAQLLEHNLHVFNESELSIKELKKIAFHCDDLLCDPSLIPTLDLFRQTSLQYKMALSADGGDELYLGYHTHKASIIAYYTPKFLKKLLAPLLLFIAKRIPSQDKRYSLKEKLYRFSYFFTEDFSVFHRNWRRILFPDFQKDFYNNKFLKILNNEIEEIETLYNDKKLPFFDRMINHDLKSYLEGDLLKKVDRLSMSQSLEVRVPLLAQEHVDFANSLPTNLKIGIKHQKILLKKLLHKIFHKKILNKSKTGFSPKLSEVLPIEELQKYYMDLKPDHKIFDFFDSNKLKKLINDSYNFKKYSLELFCIFNFIFWLDHLDNNFNHESLD